MRRWPRSSTLLKYLVGQHVINGLSVAAGVMAVAVAASIMAGVAAGQVATLGAISASISDFPAPLRIKARRLLTGFALALVSTTAIQLAGDLPLAQIPTVGAIAFAAGMVTGFGRWALALSMQTLIPMVFVMGLPHASLADVAGIEALLALGGFAYIGFALVATQVFDASGRRLMASEAFREFAEYLRVFAHFYDARLDPPGVYGMVIREQAALSEQMQAARALLLDHPGQSKARLRLAATIGILLDGFDSLIAAQSALGALRRTTGAHTLMARAGVVLRAACLDLRHLSIDLLAHAQPALPPDHARAADALKRAADALLADASLSAESRDAVELTARSLSEALGHIRRLERALCDDAEALEAMKGIDLSAFRARPSLNPRRLGPEFDLDSPVFRFAARLAMAMMAGAFTAGALGGPNHGNWILLTIAVILRANYGLTRQRRNDRVVGTLIGCVVAALAADLLPEGALVVILGLSLAATHAFVRLNYRLGSIGASVTGLLALHLTSPAEAVPVVTRLAFTLIGAALAHVFSYVLPLWEFRQAPKLAERVQTRLAAFADVALDPQASDQDYRLARKALIEAIAEFSDSAARMGGEPQAVRRGLEEMSAMLVAAFDLGAAISARRLSLRRTLGAPTYADAAAQTIKARAWLTASLRSGGQSAPPDLAAGDPLGNAAARLMAAGQDYAAACG